jgi:Leucine-rich repeat (LRR) protein
VINTKQHKKIRFIMPLKKQPPPLEELGLTCISKVVIKVCKSAAEKCSEKFYSQKIASGASFVEVDKAIESLQNLLFVSTAHYFHKKICQQVLSALSVLLQAQLGNEEGSSYLHQSQEDRRKSWLKDQIILRFSTLLCHQSVSQLTLLSDLDLSLVKALCAAVPDIPSLTSLDLGAWQCRKQGLLSLPSHKDGYSLVFIKNLTNLSVADVSLDFIINISNFCPNLARLTISKSEVCFIFSLSSIYSVYKMGG